MTDAELIANICNISNDELIDTLIYIGCDGYYADIYDATINELKKRLSSIESQHKRGLHDSRATY